MLTSCVHSGVSDLYCWTILELQVLRLVLDSISFFLQEWRVALLVSLSYSWLCTCLLRLVALDSLYWFGLIVGLERGVGGPDFFSLGQLCWTLWLLPQTCKKSFSMLDSLAVSVSQGTLQSGSKKTLLAAHLGQLALSEGRCAHRRPILLCKTFLLFALTAIYFLIWATSVKFAASLLICECGLCQTLLTHWRLLVPVGDAGTLIAVWAG
jgi:hypothetical protein